MGWGDELMAAGDALRVHCDTGRRVRIVDQHGSTRAHAAWAGLREIVGPNEQLTRPHLLQVVRSAPGMRPYIAGKTSERWTWRAYKPQRARFEWGATEAPHRWRAAGCVVIEPHLKDRASPNKDWGWDRWQQLVRLRPDIDWVQVGPRGTSVLDGAELIETADFRTAAAVLSGALAAVLPEGGLHHAAAAVGLRTVVLFGGYISPEQTGYQEDLHRNLFTGGEPCGNRQPCRHCARAMAAITPEIVMDNLEDCLDAEGRRRISA